MDHNSTAGAARKGGERPAPATASRAGPLGLVCDLRLRLLDWSLETENARPVALRYPPLDAPR